MPGPSGPPWSCLYVARVASRFFSDPGSGPGPVQGPAGAKRRAAKGVFLGNARDRKRLTWKTAQQHVVIWDVVFVDLSDVTVDGVPTRKVGGIGFLCVVVPLTGEDTLTTD
jgi:hypothetical protein